MGGAWRNQRQCLLHGMRHIGAAQGGACGNGLFAGFGKVESVRPQQHGAAAGAGFDQVLPAEFFKTAAHEHRIGHAVVQGHFAHAVAQPNGGSVGWLCVGIGLAALVHGKASGL